MEKGKPRNAKFARRKPSKFHHKNKFAEEKHKSTVIDDELSSLKSLYESVQDTSQFKTFSNLPLSKNTQKGLEAANYEIPTAIQRELIIHALRGNDVLGAAKTGSGKTLAFLIPVLEILFRNKWNKMDGMGALIISPTRELACQTFDVLRKIGKHHDFSAGYVTGGKHLKEEAERITTTNIIICTPGRLLQHMDETHYFNADNLQILVMDEADRLLDNSFQGTMNAIIENLPRRRQTLLFSATQTKSVKDLARLSLKDPVFISVHEHSQQSTPAKLQQSYCVCELHEKLDMLWSFVKSHLKSKVLVFIQSCKQVRFIYETFRRLRPGTTILCLHGAMKHLKRMEVFESFCRKEHAVLFATDIAARGLDFPKVNWVVQLDCPEDASTYIHRAGRTARYEEDGEALLVLLPSEEEAMIQHLKDRKIPIQGIKVNPRKMWSIKPRVESFCAAEVELKEFAQRAFVSYVKSVFFMKDKSVFDVSKLDTDSYASSLGLAIPPRIRFLKKQEKFNCQPRASQELIDKLTGLAPSGSSKELSEGSESENESEEESDGAQSHSSDEESGEVERQSVDTKSDVSQSESEDDEDIESESSPENSEDDETDMKQVENVRTMPKEKSQTRKGKEERLTFDLGDEDISDILTQKKTSTVDVPSAGEEDEILDTKKTKVLTKAAVAKRALKKKLKVNSKVLFDDEGEEVYNPLHGKKFELENNDGYEGGIDLKAAQLRMREEDKKDKEIFRQRVKSMHREKRLKEREKRKGKRQKEDDDEDEVEAVLDSTEAGSALNFLPDPDKLYGTKRSNESDEESDESNGRPVKRHRMENVHESSNIDESDSSEEDITQGISLTDQETLALKLLS